MRTWSFADFLHSCLGSSCDVLRFSAGPQDTARSAALTSAVRREMHEPASKGPVPSSVPYCVDDSHVFPAGFLNYRMTDFLIFHITPDQLHFVAYGIFVLYMDIT